MIATKQVNALWAAEVQRRLAHQLPIDTGYIRKIIVDSVTQYAIMNTSKRNTPEQENENSINRSN